LSEANAAANKLIGETAEEARKVNDALRAQLAVAKGVPEGKL
jgi:hypothetical protein